MKPLYTAEEFKKAKNIDLLPLKCYCCQTSFLLRKKRIHDCINPNSNRQGKFCSTKCQFESQNKKQKVKCLACDTEFNKTQAEIKKTNNNFCSRSCSVTYNNMHKTHGTRRSKLEIFFEERLISLYPNLSIHFNKKDTISSELDIYIPSLKLAIELNGIFHYKPIFGSKKLNQIQNNDKRKFQSCLDKNIELISLDVSEIKYFKPNKVNKFLQNITEIINNKSKNY